MATLTNTKDLNTANHKITVDGDVVNIQVDLNLIINEAEDHPDNCTCGNCNGSIAFEDIIRDYYEGDALKVAENSRYSEVPSPATDTKSKVPTSNVSIVKSYVPSVSVPEECVCEPPSNEIKQSIFQPPSASIDTRPTPPKKYSKSKIPVRCNCNNRLSFEKPTDKCFCTKCICESCNPTLQIDETPSKESVLISQPIRGSLTQNDEVPSDNLKKPTDKCFCSQCVCDSCNPSAQIEEQPSAESLLDANNDAVLDYEECSCTASVTDVKHPELCFCDTCKCNPCSPPSQPTPTAEEQPMVSDVCTCITAPIEQVKHPEGCFCTKCACNPCIPPSQPKPTAEEQPMVSDVCTCITAPIEQVKHPEGCFCTKCACNPCIPPSQPKPTAEEQPMVSDECTCTTASIEQLKHPEGCFCAKCICNPCISPSQPIPTADEKPEVSDVCTCTEPSVEEAKHPEGCFCNKCICNPCNPLKPPPEPPAELSPIPPADVKPEVQDACTCKPSVEIKHPEGCLCTKCLCNPCNFLSATTNTNIPSTDNMKHPDGCLCPKRIHKPSNSQTTVTNTEDIFKIKVKPMSQEYSFNKKLSDVCICRPLTHPEGCFCIECFCKLCSVPSKSAEPLFSVTTTKSENPKPANAKKLSNGCICVSTGGKQYPKGCFCINCLCDTCNPYEPLKSEPISENKEQCSIQNDENSLFFDAEKHVKDCVCTICVPEISKKILEEKEPPEDQKSKSGCTCICVKCVCKPCPCTPKNDQGDSKHPEGCFCTKCVCDPCVEDSPVSEVLSDPCKCEDCEFKDENSGKALKDIVEHIKCACDEVERQTNSDPGTFKHSTSSLKIALSNMQDKCKLKDQMIEALAKELKLRANSKVFNDLLKEMADCTETGYAADYDRAEICASLPRPINDPKYGKLSHLEQKCKSPKYPNCSCTELNNPQAENQINTTQGVGNTCSCAESTVAECKSPNYPNCSCKIQQLSNIKPEVNMCLCAQGGVFVDPSPLAVSEARQLSSDTLLLKWVASASKDVTGYEIDVNDILKSRIYSARRTSAVLYGLDCIECLNISIYAVTKYGRCFPPAKVDLRK